MDSLRSLTTKLGAGRDLAAAEVGVAVAMLLSDQVDDDAKAGFLIALHQKGESADELAAFVQQLTDRAVDPEIDASTLPGPIVDVCGTGGDGLDLFNVSTTIMFILAAAGVPVLKHGNRSVTSRCGSADVLEALGVKIDLSPEQLRECVARTGFGFVFARRYHPAFRSLAEMRARLARARQRTVFNLIGPLLNPARPPRQLIGVFAPRLTTIFADVLRSLGRERAWIVHGLTNNGGGMDDISISGVTTLADLSGGDVMTGVIDPRWFGIAEAPIDELEGGDATENARIMQGILDGSVTGPKRDLALVNAGGGFVVAGRADDIRAGIELAREQIDSGRALQKLRELREFQPNHIA